MKFFRFDAGADRFMIASSQRAHSMGGAGRSENYPGFTCLRGYRYDRHA